MRAIGEADLQSRVARLSLDQKVRLLTGADFWALYPEPGAGLRRIVTSDGPAGVRGETWDERDTSANIPSPTALAATWDCDRVAAQAGLLREEQAVVGCGEAGDGPGQDGGQGGYRPGESRG